MSGNRSLTDLEETYVGVVAPVSDQFPTDNDEPNTDSNVSGALSHTLVTTSNSGIDLPDDPTTGELKAVGKYRIKEVLGRGGMGVVYRAFDPLIQREVALKVVSPEIASSPEALQRFLGEARSIGRLNHPHVVSIYEINEWNGHYYLVMELLTGGSVADLSERRGSLPWKEACRIVAQAARGLAAAHAAGMVHRDVKPANLMLTQAGDVKVVDFGLSKILDATSESLEAITRAGQVLGTPQYMSPEQFECVGVDLKTDIYALGGSLYRLLTDQFPYHECTTVVQLMKAHVMKPVPVPSRLNARLPNACDRIISKAMAKEPSDRYASCDEMAAELEQLIAANPVNILRQTSTSASLPVKVVTGHSPADTRLDRVLCSAMVVEPSKLQTAMRKDLLLQAGANHVTVANSIADTELLLQSENPDIIWTAMELPDGRGVDWLRSVGAKGTLQDSTVVLNCSDGKVADLVSVGKAGCLILAPKTARLESVLTVIHGAGPVRLSNTAMSKDLDLSAALVRVISSTGKVPDRLTSLFNELQLKDVEVNQPSTAISQKNSLPCLTLLIRSAERMNGDEEAYVAMVSIRRNELAASVQATSDGIFLRSVGHAGVTATLNRSLNAAGLYALLQVADRTDARAL